MGAVACQCRGGTFHGGSTFVGGWGGISLAGFNFGPYLVDGWGVASMEGG